MIKVKFLSWHYKTPEILLNQLKKMTPGCTGKWLDMEATLKDEEVDYFIVMDGSNERTPEDRTIFVGQHPLVGNGLSKSFRTFEDRNCAARVRLDKHWNPGEIWLNYTYDQLKALSPNNKVNAKKLCCIATYQTHNSMYNQRVIFLRELFKNGIECDLFGRPSEKYKSDDILASHYLGFLGQDKPDGTLNEHTNGKNIVGGYQYSVEMDVGPTKNYISERFYDAMLLWTFPIYFGSTNVNEILPAKSFYNIDIHTFNQWAWLKKAIADDRLRDWGAMHEARELLLDKYQLWPAIHHTVNNLKDYQ